jgi:hypothetical protein
MRARGFLMAVLAGVLTLVGLAGCEGNGEPPLLEQSQVTIGLEFVEQYVRIKSGSGDYAVVVSDPAVASASIEKSFYSPPDYGSYGSSIGGAYPIWGLLITPKAAGTAVITVIDRNTGGQAKLDLKVEERRYPAIRVADIVTNIDADNPAPIEYYLAIHRFWVKGGGIEYVMELDDGGTLPDGVQSLYVRFVDADGSPVATAEMIVTGEDPVWNTAFDFLPITTQIGAAQKFVYKEADWEWVSNYYSVQGAYTRMNVPVGPHHVRIYEDLTNYFKTNFHDAGVRSVVRVVIANQQ